MKKIMIVLCVVIIIFAANNAKEELIIPDEAIRIRVVANSNSASDQMVKQVVRSGVESEITDLLMDAEDIDAARSVLESNLENINKTVERILEKNDYDTSYKVDFGYNHFPEKKYKGVVYEEGYYESIVITLGSGQGDNWWCVLFPPLCLMKANEEDIEEVEYTSFIKELIDKYF